MADVAPINANSVPNFALMQQQAAQAGAAVNLTNQQAQLTMAQTQAADIANQKAGMMLQLYQGGLQHVFDFSGQNGGQHPVSPLLQNAGAADQSGADLNTPAAVPQSDASVASGTPDQSPGDDIGESAADSGQLESNLEGAYNVNPAGTPAQQAAIQQAYAKTQDPLIAMNPQLEDWAQKQLAAAKGIRDQDVASRQNISRVMASRAYDVLRAVQDAPPGTALQALQKTPGGPVAASKIIQANPGATPAQLDETVRDTVAHSAGFLFRFTGRPAIIGPDGNWYDKESGLGISGAPPTGFSQAQVESIRSDGLSMVQTVQNGHQVTEPKWQASGAANIDDYTQRAVNNFQALQRGRDQFSSTATQTVQGLSQLPGNNPAVRQRAAQIRQQQSGAPGAPPPQSGVGAPGAQPATAGAQPTGAAGNMPPPDPTMPGSDPKITATALQDPSFRPVPAPGGPLQPGAMRTPDQQEYYSNQQKNQQALYQQAQTTLQAATQRLQLLQKAKAIIASGQVRVGPYSSTEAFLSNYSPMSSGTDAALYAELKKDLGNAALLQAKGSYGSNMTEKEAMTQKDELSPSPSMPPQALNDLITQQIRGANYDIAAAKLAPAYLRRGLDPNPARYSSWLQQYYPRENAINGPAASTSPAASGAATSGPVRISSAQQYNALAKGSSYIDPSGTPRVKQ